MALKTGTPNPLNFFNIRRVGFACPHFKYFTIERFNPELIRSIQDWIEKNLNNRYYIDKGISLNAHNAFVYNITIGFESEKELGFFVIACSDLIIK
jgi:hypothetical protein